MKSADIQLVAVSRRFGQGRGQVQALRDITLSLPTGSQAVLIGPSGSGKTTLLNLIGALDRPTSGTVTIGGERVSAFNEERASDFRRNSVGFVFQDDALLPELTLVENVELPLVLLGVGRKERRRRVEQLLSDLGLQERCHAYPALLSGGEKQRAAVARAVIHRPRILLADEPTANLDGESAAAVLRIMRQLADQEQLTMLISSHDPRVFQQFKQSVQLCDGSLIPESVRSEA